MVVALILVSAAFLVTLFLLVTGRNAAAKAPPPQLEEGRTRQLEADLDKRRKEVEEHKRQLNEVREELKQAKRKLHEQRESDRDARELAKARAEAERSASVQLESVRTELAHALAEVDRLKRETTRPGRPQREPAPHAAAPHAPAAAPAPAPVAPVAPVGPVAAAEPEKPRRVIRELNDADKERMERLEADARRERQRAVDLDREVKRLKSRGETQSRVYVVTKGELDLLKDKFKALEKRMNRRLLENDLLRRAIRDLEKKTGISAERTELTADEAAASDRQVEERVNAEAAKEAERQAAQVRAAEEAAQREAEPPHAEEPAPTAATPPAAPAASERH